MRAFRAPMSAHGSLQCRDNGFTNSPSVPRMMPTSAPRLRRGPADSLLSRPSASPGIMLTDGSAASVGRILEDEDTSVVGRPAAGPSAVVLVLISVGPGAGSTSPFSSEGAVGRGGGLGFRVVDDTSVGGLGRESTTESDSVAPSSVGRGRGCSIVENPGAPATSVDERVRMMVKKPLPGGLPTGLVGRAAPLSSSSSESWPSPSSSPESSDSSSEIGDSSCLLSCLTRMGLPIGTSSAPPSRSVVTLGHLRIECLLSLFLRSFCKLDYIVTSAPTLDPPQICAVYHGCDPLGHCARQCSISTASCNATR